LISVLSTGRGSKKPSSRDGLARRLNACAHCSARITALVRLNPVRVDLVERFEKLVADYNAGSINTETFFQELLNFSTKLTAEEARSLSEGLTEEQLAIFDLLMRPAPELSDDEKA
jgi:type I restriction enzyme R subunit